MKQAPFVPFVPDQFELVIVEPHAFPKVATPPPNPATTEKDEALPEGMVMLSDLIADLETEPYVSTEVPPHPDDAKGMARPLSKQEKWNLSSLAKAAFAVCQGAGLIPPGQTEAMFRRLHSEEACGRRISEATFGDRMKIQAKFLELKGSTQGAARAAAKAVSGPLDIARFKLQEALRKGNFPESYAEGISRRVYKRSIAELTTREVWRVIYTLNNNANSAAGKGTPANRWKKLKGQRQAAKQERSL